MHKKAYEMIEHAMSDACKKGYDCLTAQDWDNFKDCVETAEKVIKAEYFYHLVCEMKKDEGEQEKRTAEALRDIDKKAGKLYFTEPMTAKESAYDRALKEHWKVAKEHATGTPEDKQATMRSAEAVLNIMFDDIDKMVEDASPELKNMIKAKGTSRIARIS